VHLAAVAVGKIDTGATAWVLAASALVLLMTPGVAFFYGGMVRAKHVLSMLMQNFMTMALVSVVWVLVAFSLAFGKGNAFIGDLHFAGLAHIDEVLPGYTGAKALVIPPLVFAIFQMMFAIITPALVTGSTADRWRFGAFVPFMIIWSVLVYAPIAHWVFSPEGWADKAGALDFAGGTVVHSNCGAAGLAMALVLGRRRGWPSHQMRPHNLPFVLLGAALLWFGWFGFNAGSALSADSLAGYAFINTNTAASVGMLTWVCVERLRYGKATTLGAASGVVAGLVAITPCAGYVSPVGAIVIGLLAGAGCALAVTLKTWLGYDDALDVVGVHLVGGVIGSLGVGLFATKTINPLGANGLFYGGGYSQLGSQTVTVLAVVSYSFVVTYMLGTVLGRLVGNRVGSREETGGLDLSVHGEAAYELDGLAPVPDPLVTQHSVTPHPVAQHSVTPHSATQHPASRHSPT
jgi:Amt family ammonium transporter